MWKTEAEVRRRATGQAGKQGAFWSTKVISERC